MLFIAAALVLGCCASSWADVNHRVLDGYVLKAMEAGADEHLARELLHVEELAGVPDRYRGMVLAKASFESGFNPLAVGDNGKAVGLLQLWPWAERIITDRRDPVASAHAFLGTIVSALRLIKRRCPKVRDPWRLVWIRVNRGPRWRRPDRAGQPRCTGTHPAGLKVLRRWRRQVHTALGIAAK